MTEAKKKAMTARARSSADKASIDMMARVPTLVKALLCWSAR